MAENLVVELHLEIANAEPVAINVSELSGREAISELFSFDLSLALPAAEELPEEVAPGAIATLEFRYSDEVLRRIHGVLESVTMQVDSHAERPTYRARLVPRATRSTLIKTQQIYMDQTIVQIMQHKLKLVGLREADVKFDLDPRNQYPEREFVVQYKETDHAFVSRLAEHRGISYYFDHSEGCDRIVFVDHQGAFKAPDLAEEINITNALDQRDRVYELSRQAHIIPSNYITYDHNYRKPTLPLLAKNKVTEGRSGGIIEFGAHLKDKDESKALSAVRADELGCRQVQYRGDSSIVKMTAGGVTTLGAYQAFDDVALLITAVEHTLKLDDGNLVYRNRFDAVGCDVTYRPERKTPKPFVAGIVTGEIQGIPGADGKSPHLDDEGRYTVKFHFDSALGDPSQKASRPVRMAQPFGGTGHGMHFPLRPGTEVILAFTNGDPDRPILLGAVPNALTRTPVTATNSTQNRIVAKSGALFEISEKM
jgi:type VI secretion system secreted protein VgrG